jgi:hypothetical protein
MNVILLDVMKYLKKLINSTIIFYSLRSGLSVKHPKFWSKIVADKNRGFSLIIILNLIFLLNYKFPKKQHYK